MTRLLRLITLLAIACAATPVSGGRPSALISAGVPAFGGGPGGGGTPTPPIGLAPIAPTLDLLNSPFFVRVALVAEGPRVVVLRSRDGRLLHVTRVGPARALALPIPADGALLDILGTDVIGLLVTPGSQLTVIDG